MIVVLKVEMAQVETKDALLHAINEEYVEAVEVLAAFNMIMRRC